MTTDPAAQQSLDLAITDPGSPAWTPELPPEIVKRLAAVHVRCVRVHWNNYFQVWWYDLVRTNGRLWTPRAQPDVILMKAASGVMGVLQGFEAGHADKWMKGKP